MRVTKTMLMKCMVGDRAGKEIVSCEVVLAANEIDCEYS
jgi:hypothetical protein